MHLHLSVVMMLALSCHAKLELYLPAIFAVWPFARLSCYTLFATGGPDPAPTSTRGPLALCRWTGATGPSNKNEEPSLEVSALSV